MKISAMRFLPDIFLPGYHQLIRFQGNQQKVRLTIKRRISFFFSEE